MQGLCAGLLAAQVSSVSATQTHQKALRHCRLRIEHIVLLSIFVFETQTMTVQECSAAPLLCLNVKQKPTSSSKYD